MIKRNIINKCEEDVRRTIEDLDAQNTALQQQLAALQSSTSQNQALTARQLSDISGLIGARSQAVIGQDVTDPSLPGQVGGGTVTSLAAGTGITLTPSPITSTGTINLANTAVTPGTYTYSTITVDQQGRLTAASSGAAPTGTVTSVSVVSANGFAGTVATATTTPAITLTTTITGVLKGNGTAISAAGAADIISALGYTPTDAAVVPSTAPSAGQILVGNAGNTAYAKQTVSGSGATITLASTGVMTISGISNASLTNSSITINGTSVSLGGTRTLTLASADFVNQGTTTTVLHGNAAGNPSFAAVSLTADVTGTLPAGNGGTGITSLGTGVATALGINVGTTGSFAVNEIGTWTPVRHSFTEVLGGGSITNTGTYVKVGNLVHLTCKIAAAGGATVAAIAGSSYISGHPYAPAQFTAGQWVNQSTETTSGATAKRTSDFWIVCDNWTAATNTWVLTCIYEV